MLFKNSPLIISLFLLSTVTLGAQEYAPIDGNSMINKAVKDSADMDLQSIVDRANEVDISSYNIEGLRDAMNKEYGQVKIVDETVEGFSDVMSDPENTRTMNPLQAISGLANENDARNREEMLNFLGLSEKRNHLYIFVSYSMPEDMIAAYSREAMWAGASLVIKGLEEGKDIGEFIQGKAVDLLGGRGYTAALHFDPRLFDAFNIDYVPSIVLADENFIAYCEDTNVPVSDLNKTKRCKSRPSDKYVKISGAITLDYALEQFVEEGTFADGAQERLNSLRSNIGFSGMKDQVEVYEFDDELLPHQKKKLYDAYSKFGEVIDTEYGISVIPFDAPKRMGVHLKRHGPSTK